MLKLDNALLFISARSPFARRVRLALYESGVPFEERVLDLFGPEEDLAELFALNPLGRVPVARLTTGEVIVDSHEILDILHVSHPERRPSSAGELFWTANAVGFCEKLVEYFLESKRPEAQRSPDVKSEFLAIHDRFFTRLDADLADGREFIGGTHFSQADLDLGTACAYTTLRHSGEWQNRFPAVARHLARLEKRQSFAKTRPPA